MRQQIPSTVDAHCSGKSPAICQVEKLPLERILERSIVWATGVARMMAAKLTKKLSNRAIVSSATTRDSPEKFWEMLELDKIWIYVGNKAHKGWL